MVEKNIKQKVSVKSLLQSNNHYEKADSNIEKNPNRQNNNNCNWCSCVGIVYDVFAEKIWACESEILCHCQYERRFDHSKDLSLVISVSLWFQG